MVEATKVLVEAHRSHAPGLAFDGEVTGQRQSVEPTGLGVRDGLREAEVRLVIGRGPGRGQGRQVGGQPEVVEDGLDDLGVFDELDHAPEIYARWSPSGAGLVIGPVVHESTARGKESSAVAVVFAQLGTIGVGC